MPYIVQERRRELGDVGPGDQIIGPGELNFVLTCVVDDYIHHEGLSYKTINEVIGALECAKLELYRRVATPYEEVKRHENGEVYSEGNLRRGA